MKLHKNPINVRPIVSHINSATSNLSDYLLKPIVEEIPHILNNSTELIQDLKQVSFSSDFILVSLNTVSLYPSIPTLRILYKSF